MPKTIATLRWTIERAASEFQVDRKTITKRIRGGDILAGPDGKFSTEQICAAVFGDYRREQLRELREKADKLTLENEVTRKERIPIEDCSDIYQKVFQFVAGTLKANRDKVLTEPLINEMFADIRTQADLFEKMA
jgi:phage terminase Nu1 subunit (DNA packaging protein)